MKLKLINDKFPSNNSIDIYNGALKTGSVSIYEAKRSLEAIEHVRKNQAVVKQIAKEGMGCD